jgi:hypothetical protein
MQRKFQVPILGVLSHQRPGPSVCAALSTVYIAQQEIVLGSKDVR